MYRLVVYHRDVELCGDIVSTKEIYEWCKRPTTESVQEVIDNVGAYWLYWVGSYCGQKPPNTAMFAIWFVLEWLDHSTGLWHTTFPKQDWMVNDEF